MERVPRRRCGAQPRTEGVPGVAETKEYREDCCWRGREKRVVGSGVREVRYALGHTEFSRWREWFHAADLIRGGERSWISAAVSRSMTFMGPPHLGQR